MSSTIQFQYNAVLSLWHIASNAFKKSITVQNLVRIYRMFSLHTRCDSSRNRQLVCHSRQDQFRKSCYKITAAVKNLSTTSAFTHCELKVPLKGNERLTQVLQWVMILLDLLCELQSRLFNLYKVFMNSNPRSLLEH